MKNWNWPLTIAFIVLFGFVLALICFNERPMPPGYVLTTNGAEYRWQVVYPYTSLISNRYSSKMQAKEEAWKQYNYVNETWEETH